MQNGKQHAKINANGCYNQTPFNTRITAVSTQKNQCMNIPKTNAKIIVRPTFHFIYFAINHAAIMVANVSYNAIPKKRC
jgi:hypothetical protein